MVLELNLAFSNPVCLDGVGRVVEDGGNEVGDRVLWRDNVLLLRELFFDLLKERWGDSDVNRNVVRHAVLQEIESCAIRDSLPPFQNGFKCGRGLRRPGGSHEEDRVAATRGSHRAGPFARGTLCSDRGRALEESDLEL